MREHTYYYTSYIHVCEKRQGKVYFIELFSRADLSSSEIEPTWRLPICPMSQRKQHIIVADDKPTDITVLSPKVHSFS